MKQQYHPGYDEKQDSIELEDYNPEWPALAKIEIAKLNEVLPAAEIIDMQHVGSTAIPYIKAKPVIDIQIAVVSLAKIKPIAIKTLAKLGYVFWENNPDPGRLLFIKGIPPYGKKRTHHVHIVEPSHKEWHNKIAFRDYLVQHPELAKEYEALKIKLADQYRFDREKYTDAKKDFINHILKLCGIDHDF